MLRVDTTFAKLSKHSFKLRVRASLPIAKVISGIFDSLSGLVLRIKFSMDHMALSEQSGHSIMNMCWEALKACLIAQKPMDVDQQQLPFAISFRV